MAFLFDEFQHMKIQLEEIKSSTDNFADNKAIGVGGFGKVYKGEISHSNGRSMVAFKRLDSRLGQGNSEFWKEIMMLSRYTHENLVSLLGYCDEGGEKILVYEYASRGSLDRHLSDATLTWTQRLKICIGVAKGLNYLHDPMGTQQRVIHRDIKSANILLDENWNAKVSDFGLSKIGPANQHHTALVTNAVGTLGYLDPLYLEMGVLTKESDVYSFGVVLFEVLCGRLCFEHSNRQYKSFVRLWKQSYKQKKLDEIIYQDLIQQTNPSALETYSDIAYLCLQESHEERPSMVEVVEKLEIALQFQEIYELKEVPKEQEGIFKTAVAPLIFRSEDELKRLLSNGILVNRGKTWFSLNRNGEHCELISAKECVNPSADEYRSEENSRFTKGCYRADELRFGAQVRARFLSPGITYTVNLVFKFLTPFEYPSEALPAGLKYKLEGVTESLISYIAYEKENVWMMVELYQFISNGTSFDLDIQFEGSEPSRLDLIVEGIEFRPLEKVVHEELYDEKTHMQPTSDSNVDREERPFSVSEIEALVEAVETLGPGRWRDVETRAFADANHRTYVELKDKWKTLLHTARISPQQRKGEPVPRDLLDRVLTAHANWSQHRSEKSEKLEEKSVKPEISIKSLPRIPITGANKRVVIYVTSLRVVRPTFEACRTVRSILQGFRVPIDERDLTMNASFSDEIRKIMAQIGQGEVQNQNSRVDVPRVFIGGRYIGGADEVVKLHEIGELKKLVEGSPAATPGVCNLCGGFRFILCVECNGSHKCHIQDGGFRNCTECNENGLIRCPSCLST